MITIFKQIVNAADIKVGTELYAKGQILNVGGVTGDYVVGRSLSNVIGLSDATEQEITFVLYSSLLSNRER